MAEANDDQMQTFCDQRLRPRAEQIRALFAKIVDDIAVIDDVYDRADGGALWNDSRDDGPPHLLKAGTGANPNDVLNFNAAIGLIEKLRTGTFANVTEANSFAGMWAVLQDACVRSIEG